MMDGDTAKKQMLVAALVLALLPIIANFGLTDADIKTYSAQINVTQAQKNNTSLDLGINAGRDLNYGVVPQSTNVTKKIRIASTGPSIVVIRSSGNISDLLRYDARQFMEMNETIHIEASPEGTGFYEGQVEIKIQSPNSYAGRKWIELKSYFY
jgi:hypothetical protein